MTLVTCKKCGVDKPKTAFTRTKKGFRLACKSCRRAYYAVWDAANRERRRKYVRDYRARHPDRATVSRRKQDLRRYGLTPDGFELLRQSQNNRCAACGVRPTGDGQDGLVVDHDHETGRVRGLLCSPCNRTIGHAKEDPQRLRAVANYIELQG